MEHMNIIATNEFYEISIEEELAFLEIKEKVFEFITDVNLSGKLIDFINNIDHNPDIKALIFYNQPGSLDDNQYDKFIRRILDINENAIDCQNVSFKEKNVRFREINILNTLIRKLAKLQTLVISGLDGTVVTPFIGAAMVADFRYASEDAVLSMIHNKYGLHPSGGLPFFLSDMVHHSKAMEIQMRDKIEAKEAMELGLITKLLPKENFRKNIVSEVKKYTRLNYCTIRDTKRLTNFNRQFLSSYFEMEAGLLNL
jgi:enoyl-CoA hydratase/carnithine racemase